MSVRFSEVKLTAITPDETMIVQTFIVPGHPNKDAVRNLCQFSVFCESYTQAIAVTASVAMYIFGYSAESHDADEDHLKMMEAYEADCGRSFLTRSNVEMIDRVEYSYTPPFAEEKGVNHGH